MGTGGAGVGDALCPPATGEAAAGGAGAAFRGADAFLARAGLGVAGAFFVRLAFGAERLGEESSGGDPGAVAAGAG